MRLLFKLLAAPFAVALTLTAAFFSFVVSLSDIVSGILSGIVFLLSAALFITGQTDGGIAFAVIAFLISPFGIPSFAGLLVRKLCDAGGALRAFIFS